MEYYLICITAFIASGLTLFSGFGLGTILTPVFALFFPIDLAVALTAIVHLLNNIFKLGLVGKSIEKQTLFKFGIPAFFTAFLGAYLLSMLSDLSPIYSYNLGEDQFHITPVKLVVGVLLLYFSLMDLIPALDITVNRKHLILGGLLSGFFGGLSGNQGALRSAFLIKAGLSKEVYIATGVAIACFIDVSRLTVYSKQWSEVSDQINWWLVGAATLSAFTGAFIGTRILKKITIGTIKIIVGLMLVFISMGLILGLV